MVLPLIFAFIFKKKIRMLLKIYLLPFSSDGKLFFHLSNFQRQIAVSYLKPLFVLRFLTSFYKTVENICCILL